LILIKEPAMPSEKPKKISTSWEPIGSWYNQSVGKEGLYFHKQIIIPGILRLLELEGKSSLLDLACGQGILSRSVPRGLSYVGVDLAGSLIAEAKKLNKNSNHNFFVSDATQKLPITKTDFSHAAIVLAIQNIEHPLLAFTNVAKHLQSGGKFIVVMNHPCYRIPRQSSWGIEESKKMQYRRIDCYMSDLTIPMAANPSKGEKSTVTWSFHHPLSKYFEWLIQAGFVVDALEEWCSDKISEGKAAKMENRARKEFPLFLCLRCIKK